MDYSEKWGVDVEEAVRLALIDLKLSRDEVEVTVLEQPSKGFFGIGSKLAKVRVEKKKEEKKEEAAKTDVVFDKEKGAEGPEAVGNDEAVKEKKVETERHQNRDGRKDDRKSRKNRNRNEKKVHDGKQNERNLNIDVVDKEKLEEVEEHEALTFLKDVTEKMGLHLNFKARVGEDMVYIEMDGKDSGTIIGKRGQTLDSIQ